MMWRDDLQAYVLDARFKDQEAARVAHDRWYAEAQRIKGRLEHFMRTKGLNRRRLAEILRVSPQSVSVFLSGRRRPQRKKLILLAMLTGEDPRVLVPDFDERGWG